LTRYRLRTLLIALAILPPLLAGSWVWGWREYRDWQERLHRDHLRAEAQQLLEQVSGAQAALKVGPPPMTTEERARIKKMLIEMEAETPPAAAENAD
jgi:hypothetical protein